MPNPTKERGARSKANLKRGGTTGNRKKGEKVSKEKLAAEKEVRRISRLLLLNQKYQKNLKERLEDGSLHPSVQVMLWYYAFGKPTETIETKTPPNVKIINEFSE